MFRCPNCKDPEYINVLAMVTVRLVPPRDQLSDHYVTDCYQVKGQSNGPVEMWGKRSTAACQLCGFTGKLGEFEVEGAVNA